MKQLFREINRILKYGGRTLFLFEVVFKTISMAVFYPLFLLFIDMVKNITGCHYLTNTYIYKFLMHPVTIVALLIILVFLVIYSFFEICCIAVIIEAAHYEKKVTLNTVFITGRILFGKILKRNNIGLFLYGVFIFPFSNVVAFAILFSNMQFPEYIISAFGGKNSFLLIMIGLSLALFFISIKHVFVLNFSVQEGSNYKTAFAQSRNLVQERQGAIICSIIICNIIIGLMVMAFELIIAVLLVLGVTVLDVANVGIALYLTVMKTVKNIAVFVLMLLLVPISFLVISGMYFSLRYHNRDEQDEERLMSVYLFRALEEQKKWKVQRRVVISVITGISMAALIVYAFLANNANPFENIELLQVTQITAHRGSSKEAPENTMAAFEKAYEDMADYIELDVQSTIDGEVVVMHDSDTKRTTGVKGTLWKLSYDAVSELDAGSWFASEYAGEKVPRFEEVLEYVKDKPIKLNVELKGSAWKGNTVNRTVELIVQYDMVDRCVLTSTDYDMLVNAKKLNPYIKTGYIISAAYGKYYTIENVDVISINWSYVNKSMVDAIHNNGKEIYVWTVNSPSRMRYLAQMGVDNIITDNPLKARECVYANYTSKTIYNIISYVFTREIK